MYRCCLKDGDGHMAGNAHGLQSLEWTPADHQQGTQSYYNKELDSVNKNELGSEFPQSFQMRIQLG